MLCEFILAAHNVVNCMAYAAVFVVAATLLYVTGTCKNSNIREASGACGWWRLIYFDIFIACLFMVPTVVQSCGSLQG